MSRLEHRIERDLRQIAERATPSPDAWSSILTRISDQVLDDVPVPDTWSFTEEEATMIDLETPAPTDDRQKAPKRVLVAGLLAAAALVGIVIMSSRDANDSTPTDEPSPTATVPPAPPPRALLGTTGDLLPGTYFVDEVNGRPTARIFFTIGAGWETMGGAGIGQLAESRRAPTLDSAGLILFDRPVAVFSDACHPNDGYHPGPVTTLDGLVAALSEQQGWAEVTIPSDISIDGYVGKAFQRTAPADMVYNCDTRSGIGERIPDGVPGFPDFRSWERLDPEGMGGGAGSYYEPGEIETLWILDIDGTVVLISAKPFPEASAADRAEFAAVLDSIRIERA